jgi:hypothetical protein
MLLPYGLFLNAAETLRYDIDLLARRFGVGFETICHRLSTLQRPGAPGVPFFFIRVDRAGNISKRQSATHFHFSKTGGTCPLWNVYEAFAQPGRVLRQLARMPDGRTYLWVARTVSHGQRGFASPSKTFSIGLGHDLPGRTFQRQTRARRRRDPGHRRVIANHLAALGAEVTALGLGGGDGTLDAAVEVRQADVTLAASLDAALAGIDKLDIVFNCAGIIQRGAEHDIEVFEKVLAVNLTGTMRVCTATRERLKASRGCIVNTASMLSFFGGGLVPGYAASKGGVAQLTKSLAIAYAQRHRPRLDRHAAHASPAGRPGARRPHPGAHAHGPLGHAQRRGRGGDVPLHAGGRRS